jgi:hypothetical protein
VAREGAAVQSAHSIEFLATTGHPVVVDEEAGLLRDLPDGDALTDRVRVGVGRLLAFRHGFLAPEQRVMTALNFVCVRRATFLFI